MTEASAFARVGLVVNPSASAGSAGRAAATLGSALSRQGMQVVDLSSRTAGGALAHAQQAVRDGEIDLLVVAGGGRHGAPRRERLRRLRHPARHRRAGYGQ